MMTFMYAIVAGVVGLLFLGPAGAIIGGAIGVLYGAIQSNHRRIVKLEQALNELRGNKENTD
ncbi:hypothetical protein [Paenibacillus soyae]|uniref:Uncharacterized protein n=1 Tax=Paenibacillus soyae TaxID=2969249 RepID=A0A9X2MW59_9BACL|nr:hypothetical protein [Paenibacillus soyae]MCR2806941.1 hypothetical protein [Paenibacillus soyae]